MSSLQEQDVVLAIFLAAEDRPWTFKLLSEAMGISASQVHLAWNRLLQSKLADAQFRKPIRRNLLEFLCHGAKYSFPPSEHGISSGMLTGHSHPRVSKVIKAHKDDRYVWSETSGKSRGVCVDPIHKSAINVARKSKKAYEILATLDSIRLGKAREQKVAISIMEDLLK